MHRVKCYYCNKYFDRDAEKYQKVGNRYAHLECNEFKPLSDTDYYQMVKAYAGSVLGDYANFGKIGKQLREFISTGKCTYKGIYLTVKYWYEIKKESPSRSYGGIGIVPYIYNEAQSYWKAINPSKIPKIETEEVVIKVRRNRKKLLSMEVD